MVISGLLTWCVYALSKEASGKYSEDQICLILSNRRKYVVKQLRSQQVECFCEIFDCMVKYGAGLLSLLKREMSGFGIFCPSIFKKNITSIFSVSNQSKYIYFYNIHKKPLIKNMQWSAGIFIFYSHTYSFIRDAF